MELTAEQIEFIQQDIRSRGITMHGLIDSLTDHICCAIENDTETDFDTAYTNAIEAFGDDGLQKTQHSIALLFNLKKEITMKRTMYVLGYIAVLLSTTGLLFRTMHWPGASIMLVVGVVLLNVGFLPMFFYNRYKQVAA
jgi:hypothetical protein